MCFSLKRELEKRRTKEITVFCRYGCFSVSRYIKGGRKSHLKVHCIFRQTCMFKPLTLTIRWNYKFLCKYYIVISDLGCVFFVARCNIIRASLQTKKERLSYRKRYIEKCVWETSLFWLNTLFTMPFFVYYLPLPKWRTCLISPIKIHNNII